MDAIATLIALARLYAEKEAVELTTVSWRLFNDSKKLSALIDGSDIQVRRHEQAMRWLSANWPDGLEWPSDISRPVLDTDALVEPEAAVAVTLENCGASQ